MKSKHPRRRLPLRVLSAAQDQTWSAVSLGFIKDAERSCPKERSFCQSPWCHHSGCNPSLSPGLCVGFQSCLLRFVNSPKSWFQRLGVGSLGKMAPDRVQNTYAGKVGLPQRKLEVGGGG